MANAPKNKGDRFERKAVAHLAAWCPGLTVDRPERLLGAGRKEDKGDLHVFPDVAVQVKALNDTNRALWQAVDGAFRQQANAGVALHLGMVPVMNAKATSVNWLMAATTWPAPVPDDARPVFGIPSKAVEHVRNDRGGIPRNRRIALVRRAGTPDFYIGTTEAWVAAYRIHRGPSFADILDVLTGGVA